MERAMRGKDVLRIGPADPEGWRTGCPELFLCLFFGQCRVKCIKKDRKAERSGGPGHAVQSEQKQLL